MKNKQNGMIAVRSPRQLEGMVRRLIKEIKNIAEDGTLSDGDSVNISTLLWAQDWRDEFKRLQVKSFR